MMRIVEIRNDPLDAYMEKIKKNDKILDKKKPNSITLDEIMQEQEEEEEEVPISLEFEAKKLVQEEKKDKLELGRIFDGDDEAAIEQSEKQKAQRSALEIFAEQLRKKELQPIDHAKIDYMKIRKNLFLVPKSIAQISNEEMEKKRQELEIKIRGQSCPPMIDTWDQCGLPETILHAIKQNIGQSPFPIQRQAIPALMSGRDLIAIAKTGSGKTLAFLLPALRHVLDQIPIKDGSEGPICLILAPARELALQIYRVAKSLFTTTQRRCTVIYGGGQIAQQIAQIKRGADLFVATPGRLIDLLTMQQGRMIQLIRLSFVILDEADRMFDMGFEPQITQILTNVRPDRQTALFSATFPKSVENLARKTLTFPLEIVYGHRSVAATNIEQFVEIRSENTKFMRLLQLLGIWVDRGSVLVFVDTQAKCDSIYQDILKSGYPCLCLHGGMDQADRASTISDFTQDFAKVLIATSVAGRGLDVPLIRCVINYAAPNHLEDYIHRVGRTGRAGNQGTAYTFLDPIHEEPYAPILFKALSQAQQSIPPELTTLTNNFQTKANAGQVKWAKSGFIGNRGYKFDDNELTPSQRITKAQKKQFEIEIGLHDNTTFEEDGAQDEQETQQETEQKQSPIEEKRASSGVLATALASEASAAAQRALAALSATQDLTPVERAKLLAAHFGKPGTMLPTNNNNNNITQAQQALAKARALSISTTIQGPLPDLRHPTNPNYFYDELDINDYPPAARARATQRDNISRVTEETGAAVISRGVFIPSGKLSHSGERRLHLAIEASSLYAVKTAKAELSRILNEETLQAAASGRISTLSGGSRVLPSLGLGTSVFGKYANI